MSYIEEIILKKKTLRKIETACVQKPISKNRTRITR